jgi:hypothetical protein
MVEREPIARWADEDVDLPGAGFERIVRAVILLGFAGVLGLEGWLLWRAWQVLLVR